ncbi:MAG: DUF3857 domain-containing protein [Phycisphaerales bacterium]|nr:DUF3857 domain-containing protein [Hyphomonadaceae bacterium]
MDQEHSAHREITPGARVAPPPTWADLAPYHIPAEANPHFITNGVCVLLDDSQIDLCGGERGWYYRRAEMVTASVGAERVAQFSVSFDPAFERLEVHSIAVIRAGQRIEHTTSAFFEVLRRERNMERLQFDGRLTIHVTLPDVRAGDVVETSYTLYGMRKSLGGRHASWVPFEWSVGICETRLRQRTPPERVVAERAFLGVPIATQIEADGVIDRRWQTKERPGVRFEVLAPPWTVQSAGVQFSEWRDWAEVAGAFTPLYEESAPLPADVEAEIARIGADEKTAAGRAAAVLRFTQNAVRYLAISIGEGGFTPRALEQICATRYGDCKDKSKLYVAMARRLGLDACPALVNTRDGYGLNTWLPSGVVFDHCIVRVVVDGAVYWLDPTRLMQPSPLAALNKCHFGWALPLKPGAAALERMSDPSPAHTLEAEERVTLGKSPVDPIRYEWKLTSRRGRAEWVREHIAREGQVGLFKLYAEDIARRYAGAQPLRQEIVSEDAERNEIVAVEVYEITGAWTPGQDKARNFSTYDLTIRSQLAALDAGPRQHPIYLGQLGKVTRKVFIDAAYQLRFAGWKRVVESSGLVFRTELRKEGPKSFVLEQELEFRALMLPAAEADKYRAIVAEIDQSDLAFNAQVGRRGMFIGAEGGSVDWSDSTATDWLWRLAPYALFAGYLAWRYLGAAAP